MTIIELSAGVGRGGAKETDPGEGAPGPKRALQTHRCPRPRPSRRWRRRRSWGPPGGAPRPVGPGAAGRPRSSAAAASSSRVSQRHYLASRGFLILGGLALPSASWGPVLACLGRGSHASRPVERVGAEKHVRSWAYRVRTRTAEERSIRRRRRRRRRAPSAPTPSRLRFRGRLGQPPAAAGAHVGSYYFLASAAAAAGTDAAAAAARRVSADSTYVNQEVAVVF